MKKYILLILFISSAFFAHAQSDPAPSGVLPKSLLGYYKVTGSDTLRYINQFDSWMLLAGRSWVNKLFLLKSDSAHYITPSFFNAHASLSYFFTNSHTVLIGDTVNSYNLLTINPVDTSFNIAATGTTYDGANINGSKGGLNMSYQANNGVTYQQIYLNGTGIGVSDNTSLGFVYTFAPNYTGANHDNMLTTAHYVDSVATAAGGSSFIQNQNSAPQTANSYITGEYKSRYFGYEGTFNGASVGFFDAADNLQTGYNSQGIQIADTLGTLHYQLEVTGDTTRVVGDYVELHTNRLQDTLTAVSDYDLTNKRYVDNAVASGAAVASVFGRTGAVVAASGDYSAYYYPLSSNPASYLVAADTTTVMKGRTQANTAINALNTKILANTTAIAVLPTKNSTYNLNAIPYINSSGQLQGDSSLISINPSTKFLRVNAGTTGTNVKYKFGSGLSSDTFSLMGFSDNVTGHDVTSEVNGELHYTLDANTANRQRGAKFVALINPGGFTNSSIATGGLGVEGVARLEGSGTETVMTGMYGRVLIDVAGNITNANAFMAVAPSVVTGGLITNAIGYNVNDQNSQSPTLITNSFNIVSGGTNGSNGSQGPSDGATGNWNFYGYSALPNYFNGLTGFGLGVSTSNINARVHIAAGTTTVPALIINSGPALTTEIGGHINYDGTNFTGGVSTVKNTFATDLNTMTFGSGKTWNGQLITGTYGGTGVNNGSHTLTTGGNWNFSGAFNATVNITGSTNVTYPLSGTLFGTAANSITSAQMRNSLSDETGASFLVFSDSPALTGSPTAPTQTTAINNTTIATTAYVSNMFGLTSSFTDQTSTPVTLSSSVTTGNYVWNANSASQVVFTLPTASVKGATYEIVGSGSGGWKIAQNAGDQIKGFNNGGTSISTTTGTGGSVAGVQYTNIRIRCMSGNGGSGGSYIVEFVNGTPTVL